MNYHRSNIDTSSQVKKKYNYIITILNTILLTFVENVKYCYASTRLNERNYCFLFVCIFG